eukprot:47654_5
MLTIVQCISLEGWVDYTKALIDTLGWYVVLYFLVVVLAMSLFTMNLVLAVLKDSLHNAMENMRAHAARVEAEKERLRRQNKEAEKRFRSISLQMGQLVKTAKIERVTRMIIRHPAFEKFIFWCIVGNTVVLMFSRPDMPDWQKDVSDVMNIAFAVIFALEMFIKVQGLGMKMYVRSGINLFDGLVVVLTIWSQLLLAIMDVSAEDGSKSVRLLYLLRIMRIARLMSKVQSLQIVLSNLKSCLRPFSGMFVLLALFLFVFSVLGVQLFGGKFDPSSRSNFDTMFHAGLTVFQICTREDWNQVMFDAVAAHGNWAVAYFIVCLLVGSYVIMDLMLAILLEKFQSEFNKRANEKQKSPTQLAIEKAKMPELRSITDLSDMELLDPRYLTRELLHAYNDFSAGVAQMSAREKVVYENIQAFLQGLDISQKKTRETGATQIHRRLAREAGHPGRCQGCSARRGHTQPGQPSGSSSSGGSRSGRG